MIADLLELTADPGREADLARRIEDYIDSMRASAGQGDARQVARAEAEVLADPQAAFRFDTEGYATLHADGGTWHAGRFRTPSLAELRGRVSPGGSGRLWLLDGGSPATDVGSLQATAPPGTLFQVASQFNCLDSPGPYLTRVAYYFSDPTQGPRASIGAWPATLQRHYAAPGPHRRFVQTDRKQIDLLADAFAPAASPVVSGYLVGGSRLVETLMAGFDRIRLGVHDGAEVVLGHNFDGHVPPGQRIAQVFTSTLAGGGYGAQNLGGDFIPACRLTLRAAYLGTLLAAQELRQRCVVLTLIGGGVFGNPIEEIWAAILSAFDEVGAGLDVIVNGFSIGRAMPVEQLTRDVVQRGGVMVRLDRDGLVEVRR